jgi:hypothetical protein
MPHGWHHICTQQSATHILVTISSLLNTLQEGHLSIICGVQNQHAASKATLVEMLFFAAEVAQLLSYGARMAPQMHVAICEAHVMITPLVDCIVASNTKVASATCIRNLCD